MTKTTQKKLTLVAALLAFAVGLAGMLGVELLTARPSLAGAKASPPLPVHSLGKADAPVVVTDYSSVTCSHCATFFNEVLPEIEKRYIDTGKLRFVYVDFPADGIALKAAALAHCMPEAQFFPFLKIVYKNQMSWIRTDKPDETLMQYAQMAGLPADKAKACVEDTKLLDALVAVRTQAAEKIGISATPTFVFNDHETKLIGTRSVEEFAAAVEKVLGKK